MRDDVSNRRVHRADQICAMGILVPHGANTLLTNSILVVDRTGRVIFTHPGCHGRMIGAEASFVTHAPDDNARVILVPLDHSSDTIEERIGPERVCAELRIVVM